MISDRKEVTYKHLRVGQEIKGWKVGNLCTMTIAVVKDVKSTKE